MVITSIPAHKYSLLFIDRETLLSPEGVTWGPIGYGHLCYGDYASDSCEDCKKTWMNITRCGTLMMCLQMDPWNSLRSWWDKILDTGPLYGYYANPSKTVLIVKKEKLDEAQASFDGTCVKV